MSFPSIRHHLLALALAAGGLFPAAAQRVVPVASGNNYTFTLGKSVLEVGPSPSARIRSWKYDGIEQFYTSTSGGNNNWGTTFWPSPQAHWTSACRSSDNNACWPPPSQIDAAGTTYSGGLVAADTTVSYVSQPNAYTGLRIRKTMWADFRDSSFSIRYHMVNTLSTGIAFAPWELTRFTSGGMMFYPSSPLDSLRGNGVGGAALISMVRDTLGTKWLKYDSTVTLSGQPKIWDDGGAAGWCAHVNNKRVLLIKKFQDTHPSRKAPGSENEIEYYAQPNRSYVEMELQGPFDSIPPGDSAQWDMKWYFRAVPPGLPINRNSFMLDLVNQTLASATALQGRAETAPAPFARMRTAGSNINLTLARPANVSLLLVDFNGAVVHRLHAGPLETGAHDFRVGTVPPGLYRLILKDDATGILETRMFSRL